MFASGFIIFSLPYHSSYGYRLPSKDYANLGWIYEKLTDTSNSLDMVFFGTSHILNGVQDSVIQAGLSNKFDRPVRVLNLGLNHSGRNLHYSLIKELYRRHTPQYIFLEVRATESKRGHFLFPFVAEQSDILSPVALININFLRDILQLLVIRRDYLLEIILGSNVHRTSDQNPRYGYQPNYKPTSKIEIKQASERLLATKDWYVPGEFISNLKYRYPLEYLSKIGELVQVNGGKLAFIYLPFFGAPDKPVEIEFLRELGPVYLPPKELLENIDYWSNSTHLSRQGAGIFSEWLLSELRSDLQFATAP